jgi:hypothetical protein
MNKFVFQFSQIAIYWASQKLLYFGEEKSVKKEKNGIK